jgi:hypothetical protein
MWLFGRCDGGYRKHFEIGKGDEHRERSGNEPFFLQKQESSPVVKSGDTSKLVWGMHIASEAETNRLSCEGRNPVLLSLES